MHELRLIILLVAGMLGLVALQALEPDLTVGIVLVLLGGINLGMTWINCWQAWKADPRYLGGGWLGAIQTAAGVPLTIAFLLYDRESTPLAAPVGASFIAGGLLAMAIAALRRCFKPARQS
jgi:hypothetical protein